MSYIGFVFFLLFCTCYLWDGKDFFNKRDWLVFLLKFIGVFIVTILFGFTLKGIMHLWPGISLTVAKHLTTAFGASLISVLGMKFLVVMLCAIFRNIMAFHENHNVENFDRLSVITNKFAPTLLILAKFVVTCGSVLIFYGIWLA
ncbi:hypothetical protein [Erwinia sp. E_sp_B04_7]|uniref:hypothetical protein n=1 Tax=unclassified Erwinia TaxID=2622719 RepID=UPI0030D4B164